MNSKRPFDSPGPLRLFAVEFITGGGLAGEPIPPALAREGDGMLRALLRDLLEIEGVEIVTTRDARLPPLGMSITEVPVREHAWECWTECIGQAQAVWPIAPETGGVLERLSRLVLQQERLLLGSRREAIAIAASKRATAERLAEQGVPVVWTVPMGASIPESPSGWVIKPDDGAGCENTYFFDDAGDLRAWHGAEGREGYVVQPYIPGAPASLSLLCKDGIARVLACNEQQVERRGGQLHCLGIKVNALHTHREALTPLAQRVAQALPGLWGYVGVDLVLSEDGPVVMEVNPRLTTSYVGLAQAIEQNPAELVLDLLRDRNSSFPHSRGRVGEGVRRLNFAGLNPHPNLPPARGKG